MDKRISSQQAEDIFDEGGDVLPYAEDPTFERPHQSQRRVSVDMNEPMVVRLDGYASEYGVTRQSLMKIWLAERLDEEDDHKARRTARASR
ncbi:CopG family transcriptional regulator [Olsenella sp. SW781]|uniref:type II toxin-antitoxin system BrnA family antitoxin n=1 Tax=Olsenella sp. SW781 TaxID=2530046 RepID=UPI00143C4D81|nr:CopG family transcriptional regulator [Olsenella sp. SW781]NJE80664.1 CopG family transcriptional regulator [Olsenella sp. SW781]